MFTKTVLNGFVVLVSDDKGGMDEISETEYNDIMQKIQNKPGDIDGYAYKLRADSLEWELVELPPVETETLTDEEALTRYANSITGANDTNIIGVAETLINEKIKEG